MWYCVGISLVKVTFKLIFTVFVSIFNSISCCTFAGLTSTATSSHSVGFFWGVLEGVDEHDNLSQFMIHWLWHCSTQATIQEMRPKMTTATSFLGCQGCIHRMRTAHLCLDICNPQICKKRLKLVLIILEEDDTPLRAFFLSTQVMKTAFSEGFRPSRPAVWTRPHLVRAAPG